MIPALESVMIQCHTTKIHRPSSIRVSSPAHQFPHHSCMKRTHHLHPLFKKKHHLYYHTEGRLRTTNRRKTVTRLQRVWGKKKIQPTKTRREPTPCSTLAKRDKTRCGSPSSISTSTRYTQQRLEAPKNYRPSTELFRLTSFLVFPTREMLHQNQVGHTFAAERLEKNGERFLAYL